jgi:hypothetical protein
VSETINISFDSSILPEWARSHPAVVALCAINLDYRCDICRVTTDSLKRMLIERAEGPRED